MNYDDILDDIEGLDVPRRVIQPTGFKKKTFKSKKATLRAKHADELIEEVEEDEVKENIESVSRRRHFKTVSVKPKKVLPQIFEHDDAPVIENLSELTQLEREQLLGTTPEPEVIQEAPKKYVPIETNSFIPLNAKQMKKELKLEYANEYNYDDGSNIPDVVETVEDNDDDEFYEDEPLESPLNPLEEININKDMYDTEIGPLINKEIYDLELDSDSEREDGTAVANVHRIAPLNEEVDSLQETIKNLEISIKGKNAKKVEILNDLETIKTKKDELLKKLSED